jgi:hypothetical protein
MRKLPRPKRNRRPSGRRFAIEKLARLEGESSNTLFDVLTEWERHLAQLDPKGLGCRDDKPKP